MLGMQGILSNNDEEKYKLQIIISREETVNEIYWYRT